MNSQGLGTVNLESDLEYLENTNMPRITAYLSDPLVIFREGIHFILSGEENIDVVGEGTANPEALRFIESTPPLLAILYAGCTPDGFEIAAKLRASFSPTAVILTLDRPDDALEYSALTSGARAVLTRGTDPDALLETVKEVAGGGLPICRALLKPALALRALEDFEDFAALNRQANDMLARLTAGEADILRRVSEGAAVEQLAHDLNLQPEAVSGHILHAARKLAGNSFVRSLMLAALQKLGGAPALKPEPIPHPR